MLGSPGVKVVGRAHLEHAAIARWHPTHWDQGLNKKADDQECGENSALVTILSDARHDHDRLAIAWSIPRQSQLSFVLARLAGKFSPGARALL